MHRVLFGVRGKNTQIKKNIRDFSGFTQGDAFVQGRSAFLEGKEAKLARQIAAWPVRRRPRPSAHARGS